MIDLEAIKHRNAEASSAAEMGNGHSGLLRRACTDIDALILEVERLRMLMANHDLCAPKACLPFMKDSE